MKTVVVATRNKNKLQEILGILPKLNIEFKTLADFSGIPDIVEDGLTLKDNAIKKATTAAFLLKIPALADDTGLEVDFLKGAPGVKSARYSGIGATYEDNNIKLLKELQKAITPKQRRAVFKCVVALSEPCGKVITEEGKIYGYICKNPRGLNGFGYDPLFVVDGLNKTLAELSPEEKNKISHRAIALKKMLKHIRGLED